MARRFIPLIKARLSQLVVERVVAALPPAAQPPRPRRAFVTT